MKSNTLLQKQIAKHLTAESAENPNLKAFIQAINDTYLAFEKELEICNQTFEEYKNENIELKDRLHTELEIKKLALHNFKDILAEDHLNHEVNPDSTEDLLQLSLDIKAQITRTKLNEIALLEKSNVLDDYKNALDQAAIFAITDQKGIIKAVNDKLCEISQYSREELLGNTHQLLNSQFHSKSFFKELYKTISSGAVWQGLIKNEKKNGGYYWVDTTIVPFLDANKKPFQYLAIRFDVTDIKNAEIEIREAKERAEKSEEQNRSIMDSSLNSIVSIDDNRNITFWNKQSEVIFGWKKEEVVGKPMIDLLIPSRYREMWNGIIDQYHKNEESPYFRNLLELHLLRKDGTEFFGETFVTPLIIDGTIHFCGFIQDVSKRKEAENQQRQTAELLKTVLSSLQSGVLVEDENEKVLFSNQLFWDLTNNDTSPAEMEGIDFSKKFQGIEYRFKDSKGLVTRARDLMARKQPAVGDLLETNDNRFLEGDYIPIYVDNEYKGHLWKFTDVTHSIKRRNLLIQSEIRSNVIMNASLNAIITIDAKGVITFWNQQAETIFGWTKDEVLGKVLSTLIIPHHYLDAHDIGMKHYLKTGEGPILNKQIELTALNKMGLEFPIEMSIIPIHEDNQDFFCAFIQDISEKKAVENIRKIQEEKFQNVITYMNLGLIEVDNNEIIQYANQSITSILGYEISELLGKSKSDFIDFDGDLDMIASKNELRQIGILDSYQLQIKNKSGEKMWLTISEAPNYDNSGNIIGSIGILSDITIQKQLESDVEKERTKALESSKAKEVFLANMSHEIRTPLNAIIGFLRELEKQELSELQNKYVSNSVIASKHLLAIINNILDISKIEAGEMNLESEDFVFEKSISNCTTVLRPMLHQKGLDLHIIISEKIDKVLVGDALRLQQILYNLVGNSIKFTSKGSISINCQVVHDDTLTQKVQISISDTGIGMESSFVSTIFNKFSQEDIETTRKYGGTGLGLSITKELIELMGGTIKIESEKNIGTTIHFYLIFQKSNKESNELLNVAKEAIRIDNIDILLVEDNYLNRMVAQNSLQYFNCQVTEAENGQEAIEILKNKTFDIILMDIQMPIMGGIEAALIIRNELNLSTPIIALTANAFKTEIDKCKKVGMNDYVSKPFDEEILIETIAKYSRNKVKSGDEKGITETSSTAKLYNLTSLQKLSRGNDEFVARMIAIFVEQTSDVIQKITAAILLDDFMEVGRLIHKIKPSVESLGISSITTDIKRLEKITVETTDKESISALFHVIKAVLEKVVIQLRADKSMIDAG